MKVGILYVCTGKYKIFWKDFYLSCDKYFLPETEKEYFVFTDAENIDFETENHLVHRIYQNNLGWPGNTLKRYDIFLAHKEKFSDCDYIFFLNANLLFLRPVTDGQFLPSNHESLTACIHPGYYNKNRAKFTYERNSSSTACILDSEGEYYFAGGINGGRTAEFINAMKIMSANIARDEHNGILAVWHDESHWNRYLVGRNDIKILSPAYLYPEGWILPFEKIISVRDKKTVGGHTGLRGKIEMRMIINEIKNVIVKIAALLRRPKVVKIHGGLGNQMFQYAYGRRLELSRKKIVFDVSSYCGRGEKKEIAREFLLPAFKLQTVALFSPKKRPWRNLFRKALAHAGLINSGFYQGEKYFAPIADVIKREFLLKRDLSSAAREQTSCLSQNNTVSIHVRRGDYVSDGKTAAYHGSCGLDYYRRAIGIMKEKILAPMFYIFSDDIEWAKNNFIGPEYVFVSRPEIFDVEELILMSRCKNNIIANSSFSWWGAWLNSNPDKIVIAPSKWFNAASVDTKNIIPEVWIKI